MQDLKQFLDSLIAKVFTGWRKHSSQQFSNLINKLDELKPKDFPEIPKMPEQIKVALEGVEILTLKGDKGEKGDKGDVGEKGSDGKDGRDGRDGYTPIKGADYFDGEAGKDGYSPIKGIDYFDGEKGKDGSPDTAEQIKEKLQTIQEAWLELSAIKGLEDYMRIFGDGFLSQAKAFIPRTITALYDVDVNNISDQQSLIWDASKRKFVPGAASGGGTGFTKLAATGTVDGTNTAFTFTQKPTYVVSDGAWYVENSGWTWSGSTATLTIPPQTGIWGFV